MMRLVLHLAYVRGAADVVEPLDVVYTVYWWSVMRKEKEKYLTTGRMYFLPYGC